MKIYISIYSYYLNFVNIITLYFMYNLVNFTVYSKHTILTIMFDFIIFTISKYINSILSNWKIKRLLFIEIEIITIIPAIFLIKQK